jgi:membrane protease YdiL (CAAX protease family)
MVDNNVLKRISALLLATGIAILPSLVPTELYQEAARLLFDQDVSRNEILMSALLVGSFIYFSASIVGCYLFQGRRELVGLLKWNEVNIHAVLYWCGLLLLLSLVYSLIALAMEKQMLQPWLVYAYTNGSNLPLLWLIVGVVVPVSEELLFRGYLFSAAINANLSKVGAVIASTFIWTSVHFDQELLLLSQIVMLGILLGWSRLATNGIFVPIVLHVISNVAAMTHTASFLLFQ